MTCSNCSGPGVCLCRWDENQSRPLLLLRLKCTRHITAGGGAWNHALYFKHLAPAASGGGDSTAISPALAAAIKANFGGLDKLQTELTTAATKVFGSGWAWLCYTGGCCG